MEPLTLYLSQRVERVMQRILGISDAILAHFFSSRNTSLLSLSFILTLVQVFFLVLAAFFEGSALAVLPPLASLPLSSFFAYGEIKVNNQIGGRVGLVDQNTETQQLKLQEHDLPFCWVG